MEWIEVSEDRYHEMLEVLYPALWVDKGFLVGEPTDARVCRVKNRIEFTYGAFIRHRGKYYECKEPLTVHEFLAVKPATIATSG